MAVDTSLLEIYVYENLQLLEQLETLMLAADKCDRFTEEQVGSIFRILHTIKGSSAMMEFDNLAKLSHAMEDLFGHIREHIDDAYDHRRLCDMVFAAGDFLREEIEKVQGGDMPDGDSTQLQEEIHAYFAVLRNGGLSQSASAPAQPAQVQPTQVQPAQVQPTQVQPAPAQPAQVQPAQVQPAQVQPAPAQGMMTAEQFGGGRGFYKAVVFFEKHCKMENIRAFGIIKSIENICKRIATIPEDVLHDQSDDYINENGFTMFIESDAEPAVLEEKIAGNILIESLAFEALPDIAQTPLDRRTDKKTEAVAQDKDASASQAPPKYSYMSVRLDKLDKLLDLVGEIVITETTVTKNPDILGMQLENFAKASRQLRKLTDELQDIVMSIRMIPISATFHKLERIVRDISKKTNKEVELQIIGEDTEMDKNVIDNLSDPLMHIIRNSMDHGIEAPQTRERQGKPRVGKVVVEARNTGGDVLILVSDDGKGLDRDALLAKGLEKGLLKKPAEEMTDKEAYGLIFTPGFSTKTEVTEFSGRGVGMDVVTKNIQRMGGSISVESEKGAGMTVTLRIPLTLAIIDGMQVQVGNSVFIVPLLSIRENFKPQHGDVFLDPDGNEMILIREECYSVVRLHRALGIETEVVNEEDGILMLLESDKDSYCLFVDRLIGEQQTVIKPMPQYIARNEEWIKSIAGCTILGDGSISLILDINNLV